MLLKKLPMVEPIFFISLMLLQENLALPIFLRHSTLQTMRDNLFISKEMQCHR